MSNPGFVDRARFMTQPVKSLFGPLFECGTLNLNDRSFDRSDVLRS